MSVGDRVAFCEYVRARSGALLRAAQAMTGNRADAEDLLQAALAKTYLAWDRIQDHAALDAYAKRAMVNTQISWWRRRRVVEFPTEDIPDWAVAEHLPPRGTFILMAALCLAIALFAVWKPAAVFKGAYDSPRAKGADLLGDLKRLVRHRAVYPAVLLMFMFQFSPGSNTPLQFYLTNTLHAPDAFYGYYNGIFLAAFIPVFFLYGWLCKRVSLHKLLWWGTAITVPQMVPLAFIHSGVAALWLAVPIGMMGGVAAAALYDLAMR